MIEFTKSYKVGDNVFATLDEAQQHELAIVLANGADAGEIHTGLAAILVVNREKVIDILSTTASSKPRARRINGGKKNRKPASQAATPPGD